MSYQCSVGGVPSITLWDPVTLVHPIGYQCNPSADGGCWQPQANALCGLRTRGSTTAKAIIPPTSDQDNTSMILGTGLKAGQERIGASVISQQSRALPVLTVPAPTPGVSQRLGLRQKTVPHRARRMILVVRRWWTGVERTVIDDQAGRIELRKCAPESLTGARQVQADDTIRRRSKDTRRTDRHLDLTLSAGTWASRETPASPHARSGAGRRARPHY